MGLLLRGVEKDEVERGQVIAKPGSITPHTKFRGQVYVLSKDEGGRHTPFFKGYRPQFYFRTTDVTGVAKLPEGTEMVMPGDNVNLEVELITPVAMDKGLRFAIREGGRTVGAGTVTEIIGIGEQGCRARSSPSSAPSARIGTTRTTKNKKTITERLELKKFCPHCRKHQVHKRNKIDNWKGRRFNGRPAVSKTASGGSNPSAPARKSSEVMSVSMAEKAQGSLGGVAGWPAGVKDLRSGTANGDAPCDVAYPGNRCARPRAWSSPACLPLRLTFTWWIR